MSTRYKIRDQSKLYFVTFTIVHWVDVFSRRIYRDIFIESLRYCQKNKGLELYAYCIMTNHIHLIIGRSTSGNDNIEGIIRDIKKFTSVKIIEAIEKNFSESRREWMLDIFANAGRKNNNNVTYQFWLQNNHPIELDGPEILQQKIDYIHNNPGRAGIVLSPEEYLYSSAKNYAGMIDFIIPVMFAD